MKKWFRRELKTSEERTQCYKMKQSEECL